MNTTQLVPLPTTGKTTSTPSATVSGDAVAASDQSSFSAHLKQVGQGHDGQPLNPERGLQSPEYQGAEGQSGAINQELLPDFAAGDGARHVLEGLVSGLTDVDSATDRGLGANDVAALQQLSEQLSSGEEVVLSAASNLPQATALSSVIGVQSLAPLPGTVLPLGGESLPSLNANALGQASIVSSLPLAAQPVSGVNTPQTAELQTVLTQQLPPAVNADGNLLAARHVEGAGNVEGLVDSLRASALPGSSDIGGATSAGQSGLATFTVSASGASAASLTGDSNTGRPVVSINTPINQPGWAQEVGSRLQILAERGNQRAEIRLNPPELGAVEVKVMNEGDRTNVTFFAQNAATRDALEAALPRLREMFGENGLQLADANVSQQQTMAGEREADQRNGGSEFSTTDTAPEEVVGPAVVRAVNGLVDTYI
ncbi:flagellar hook-length control protein FliK [bacterium SCSIO 12696]|nr:flagellar hook-length control protein FliK [bacterium SCSIO 12696]